MSADGCKPAGCHMRSRTQGIDKRGSCRLSVALVITASVRPMTPVVRTCVGKAWVLQSCSDAATGKKSQRHEVVAGV